MWQPHWQSKDPSLIPYDGVKGLKRGWIMRYGCKHTIPSAHHARSFTPRCSALTYYAWLAGSTAMLFVFFFFFFPYYPFTRLPHGIFSKHFGGGEESALLAGIVGHNLCIDRFGGPHSYMVQQGKLMKEKYEWKPVHGEVRN